MTNIILLICCIFMGYLLGRGAQKQVIARAELFSDAVKYVEFFRLNVDGKRMEVARFNEEFLKDCSEPFRHYLTKGGGCRLSAAQSKHLKDFFQNVDCATSEMLLQQLNFYDKIFHDDWNLCRESANKSALFVKIGLLCGAMVGILFL